MPVDVVLITTVALWKSPYMLLKGWKRLFEDLIGREGPFLETVCVPFAGLAILLWPLAVVGGVIGAIVSSFFLGFYSGVIVHQVRHKLLCRHLSELRFCGSKKNLWLDLLRFEVLSDERFLKFQEDSLCLGLAYIVSVVSLFDEYVNDLLYLREGTCLPRYNLGSAVHFSPFVSHQSPNPGGKKKKRKEKKRFPFLPL